MRISDWSSDVCSSDLGKVERRAFADDRLAGGAFEQALVMLERGDPRQAYGRAIRRVQVGGDVEACLLAEARRQLLGDVGTEIAGRSEERREGKECGSRGSTRWGPEQ